MKITLEIFLAVVSVFLILVVLLQPSKNAGGAGLWLGGSDQSFGKAKARGIDVVLNRITITVAVLFMCITFVVAFLCR